MRITERPVVVGIVLALVLLGGLWVWSDNAEEAPIVPTPTATSTPVQTDAEEPEVTSVLVRNSTEEVVALKSAIEVRGTATLIVDGTTHQLTAPEGSTLKDAMDQLQTEGDFTYSFRSYSGLGTFVTAINGRASTGDMVWILYVNGEKSGAGISSTHIRSSDLIEWKLEESY